MDEFRILVFNIYLINIDYVLMIVLGIDIYCGGESG